MWVRKTSYLDNNDVMKYLGSQIDGKGKWVCKKKMKFPEKISGWLPIASVAVERNGHGRLSQKSYRELVRLAGQEIKSTARRLPSPLCLILSCLTLSTCILDLLGCLQGLHYMLKCLVFGFVHRNGMRLPLV